MGKKSLNTWCVFCFSAVLCTMVLIFGIPAFAVDVMVTSTQTNWWDVAPEEEIPSSGYDSILYSEIPPLLHEIEQNSDRVKVEVMGQSAGGRNLFLVTIASRGMRDRLEYFKFFKKMTREPEKALQMLDNSYNVKVPVFVNGSIHGDEYPGTDACIRLIQKMAYDNSDEVTSLLDNIILLINVVQNPDGRVMGTRRNANGFDINRDFITQSQPESRATAAVVAKWNPIAFLDLHGFVTPMLIEPCTPPHNTNYEYDLYIKWAFYQGKAMEDEVLAQTGIVSQIPYRDWVFADNGYYWDDWPPIYAGMYPIYHGAYAHTIETPTDDAQGVNAHYASVWGALKFIRTNKLAMLQDQISVYWRGIHEKAQHPISDALLAESNYDQFNDIVVQDFPVGYVIPVADSTQLSQHQPAHLVDMLLTNGVEVEMADEDFTAGGVTYQKGSYLIFMNQPKRSLANTILESGPDVSYIEGIVFYSPPTAWSHPLLWGVNRTVINEKLNVKTTRLKTAPSPAGSVEAGSAGAYAFKSTSIQAIKAANALITGGSTLYRMESSFTDGTKSFGAGTFIIPGTVAAANTLANDYSLIVSAISKVPDEAVMMKSLNIGLRADEGLTHCMKELGFQYTEIGNLGAENALAGIDILINNREEWDGLSDEAKANLTAFFEASGDYIGIGSGITFATKSGLVAATEERFGDGDAIVNVHYDPTDSVSAGFAENGYAYVLGPYYFTELPETAKASATIDSDNVIAAGYWPGWQESNAKGKPVVIHQTVDTQDITLMGIDPTFRGHPRNTFRLVGNAVFDSVD